MRNTVAKKRAGWEGEDSGCLFGNFWRLPGFRSMDEPCYLGSSMHVSTEMEETISRVPKLQV
jgi:hypothetical protein